MKRISGIYEIKNLANEHKYIGSSIHIRRRFKEHKYLLRTGKSKSRYLQNAWNKYGKDNFKFNILFIADINMLPVYEQLLFDNFEPKYNVSKCVEAFTRGLPMSEETKERLSKDRKGKRLSKDHIEKLRIAANKYYEKRANGNLPKRIFTEEHRKKLSLARKRFIFTDETKRKMSESQKGRTIPEERKKRISESMKRYYANKRR